MMKRLLFVFNPHSGTGKIRKQLSEVLASDHICALDVGNFQERYFAYVAAFGMITSVSFETDQKLKNRLGFLAYILKTLQSIDLEHFEAACSQMTIEFEDTLLTGEFIFGAISNSTSVAGMKNFINFNAPGLFSARSERFVIHSEPTAWTLDGESGGGHEFVQISAKRQALRIALPESRKI